MHSLKISVVTAVYNREETVATTMQSVARQSYPNVEHIVQDGGSTDSTLNIINGFSGANLNLESSQDLGIYDAINRGISRSSGGVIGLMHSDDFFAYNDVLFDVANSFGDPAVDGVYGDLDYVSSNDVTKTVRRWKSGVYSEKQLRWGWMPPHPTLYLRRSVFDRWGMYDTDFQIAADYDAILRYLSRGEISLSYVPKVLVKMRLGGESNRSLARVIRKSREDYLALKRNGVGGVLSLSAKNMSKLVQFW